MDVGTRVSGVTLVDVSLDGVRWWRWHCSRVEFMGAGSLELDVCGPADIEVVSWAYLTHAEAMSLPVRVGDHLRVQVREGGTVWCGCAVVTDLVSRNGLRAVSRVVCSLVIPTVPAGGAW